MFLYATHFRRRDEEKIIFAANEGTSPEKVQNEVTVEANHMQNIAVQFVSSTTDFGRHVSKLMVALHKTLKSHFKSWHRDKYLEHSNIYDINQGS